MVKGSIQAMGLFTYDVTLEAIEGPQPDDPVAEPDEEGRVADAFSFSSPAQPYDNEFEQHPDLKRSLPHILRPAYTLYYTLATYPSLQYLPFRSAHNVAGIFCLTRRARPSRVDRGVL